MGQTYCSRIKGTCCADSNEQIQLVCGHFLDLSSVGDISLADAIKDSEDSLIKLLHAKRSGIDDRTGKGSATERVVEEHLLTPHRHSDCGCAKARW